MTISAITTPLLRIPPPLETSTSSLFILSSGFDIPTEIDTSVKIVDLSHYSRLGDEHLPPLLPLFPNTEELDLSSSYITDKGLSYIAENCPQLVKINLSFCFYFTHSGLMSLINKKSHLEHLDLLGCSQLASFSIQEVATK